jgi:hypothetical protein
MQRPPEEMNVPTVNLLCEQDGQSERELKESLVHTLTQRRRTLALMIDYNSWLPER